jgi:hypothetical protein
MTPELRQTKLERFVLGWDKLKEARQADPAGDKSAQEKAVATQITTANGIARPLADRYVAVIAPLLEANPSLSGADAAKLFTDEQIAKVCTLDDRYGGAFMVVAHHVDQILKGGKHMSRRFRRWGDVGDVFQVKGKGFRFNRVERMKVSDITLEDIQKEGYTNFEDFHAMWVKSHPKTVASGKKAPEPDELCWCHEYEPA